MEKNMLIDIAVSNPPFKLFQLEAAEELKVRMPGGAAVARMIDIAAAHSGIETRYISIPDAEKNSSESFYSRDGIYLKPDTKARMLEYERWAKIIAKNAVEKIIKQNNFDVSKISHLITVSCTGFFAPGLDYYLINEFNIPINVRRINIGFMGCAASIIGFNTVFNQMNSAGGNEVNTLLVSVELCSLHLQTEPTRDNILANMIFADGCGAALFSNSIQNIQTKLKIISTDSMLFKNSDDYMGWKVGNYGFEMLLSSNLPKIIAGEAVPAIKQALAKHGLNIGLIKHWALHPGGRAILDALQTGLDLSDEIMLPSRSVLKNFGNMSSASILFVLKEILNSGKIDKDDICCAVAFGPGLTMEIALFKGV
jgi:predicted naringenin-chalcone synthase